MRLFAWITCLLVASAAATFSATIVVNTGQYESALQAGTSEAEVDWRDADQADDTVCTESFAATELQRYLRTMTGRASDFAVADDEAAPTGDIIVVGSPSSNALAAQLAESLGVSASALDELGPEDYIVKSEMQGARRVVLIAGGGRVGTLYGAYHFLHSLGVRWYAPGEVNEEVPSWSFDTLPDLDIAESPQFLTRGFHAWENRGDEQFVLWMARNRLNYWCVEQDNRPLLHKLGIMLVGGGHVLTSYYLPPQGEYPYNHPTFDGDDARPEDPYPVSPEYQGDSNKNGKLSYFEAHPEWFGLQDGKRSDRIHGDGGDNFCTANEDAMAEWMKGAVDDLAEGRYADADIMNAWTLDAGKWCQCEQCKALGSQTDRNLLFIHAYAQAIKRGQAAGRINRPVRLLFLAYADVLQPPTRPLPADFDYEMCIATYFPIVRCYVHEFADPACSSNRRYNGHLHGWAVADERNYQGQLCIGEYYNVSGYKSLPVCYMNSMTQDIPYYYSLGARHFHYMHCTTQNWGNKSLTNWQMARQLWDVDTDCGKLWNDYFTGRYGDAYAQMRSFYENLEWMLAAVSDLKYGLSRRLEGSSGNLFPTSHLPYEPTEHAAPAAGDPLQPPDQRLYGENLGPSLSDSLAYAARCRAILDEVLASELPDRVRARVEEDERLFTYGETTLRFFDALARSYFSIREGDADAARAAFDEAQALANVLKADATSTKYASSHANASDALSASYASGALGRLAQLLGPLTPEDAKLFAPPEPLVLFGNEFLGGGSMRYWYGFKSHPSLVQVSTKGNFLYGRGTDPFDHMTGWFRLAEAPRAPLYLSLFGLITVPASQPTISGRVKINDAVVFEGDMPFASDKLTQLEIQVAPGVLKAGVNALEITNTAPNGIVGNRPWFGIDRVELRDKATTENPIRK